MTDAPVKTSLTAASLKRLEAVHPHLVSVVQRAAELGQAKGGQPFQVTEGVRTLARQRRLVKAGASRTLRSRHIPAPNGLGHAVDLVAMVAGRVSWEIPLYHRLADQMKQAARELGVPLEWGGDWRGFFDGPHFQLPWKEYPGVASVSDAPPPAPEARDLETLVPGSTGPGVQKLQVALASLGAGGVNVVDGVYCPATRAAVRAVTRAHFGAAADIVTAPLLEKLVKRAARARKAD